VIGRRRAVKTEGRRAAPSADDARCFTLHGRTIPVPHLAGALYVVATPIGNLGDVTLRALETLAAADLVACEDSRVTQVLLERYGIRRPLTTYHEHNADRRRPEILAALAAGGAVALVSDAGTPLVSDPGFRLVKAAVEAGHRVVPLPGASAAVTALSAAGLPTDAFLFAGFLPPKQGARRRRIEELATVPATLVFYEAPHRLAESLADLAAVLGDGRRAVVARELTKLFEELIRDGLGALAARIAAEPVKGEIVVVVEPPPAAEAATEADTDTLLLAALDRLPAAAAASEVARLTGRERRDLYRRAIALKGGAAPSVAAEEAEDGAANGGDDRAAAGGATDDGAPR
jgi:16S rRNA (cytidine1402-2'-O)-methyltransferase